MSDKEYAAIIGANLRRIANAAGKTQSDVCRDLKIGKSTVSSWFTGERVPRMDKIDMLCQYFHVNRSDIMEPRSEPRKSEIMDSKPATVGWYLTPETAEIAQEIFQNPELKTLFDTARDASPEDLKTVQTMMEALLRKERRED